MFCGAGEEHLGIPRDLLQEVKGGIKVGKDRNRDGLRRRNSGKKKRRAGVVACK